jgi:quercetin dioxygenase-like cupin family protein
MRTLALSLLAASSFAATAQEPVPVSDEPQHFLVFENPYVRVIDARLPPGYVSLYHIHAEDNVPVAIQGGSIEVQPLGGRAARVESETGGVSFARGGFSHRVSNRGESPVRFIDAEILATPQSGAHAQAGPLVDHELELENDRVRIYRLTLPPGTTSPSHQHSEAILQVIVAGDRMRRGSAANVVIEPGAFQWLEDGGIPEIESVGAKALEIVEIEWK